MNTYTHKEQSTDFDFDPITDESNQRFPLSSEAVLGSGAWRARLDTSNADSAQPESLQWQPERTLRQRITHAVSVPAFAGAAVFVVAVIIAIIMTVLQSGAGIDTPAASAIGEADYAEPSVASSVADAKEAETLSTPVFVHVVGEVVTPGVVELASGARAAEAIAAAGGATPLAVLDSVNLARVVTDGEQLLVPNLEQAVAGTVASQPAGSGGMSDPATGAGSLVNLNTADATLLQTLPRVGPALAQRILDWRQANGPFASIEQLMEVSGIGAKTFDGLRELVMV